MSPFPADDSLSERIRECIVALLLERGPGHTICPSEAAHLLGDRIHCRWQDLMRPMRTVIVVLIEAGVLEALQNEEVVSIQDVRGPIRLRLRTPQGRKVYYTRHMA